MLVGSGRYTSRGLPKLEPTRPFCLLGEGPQWTRLSLASAATAPPNREKDYEMAGVTRVRLTIRLRSLSEELDKSQDWDEKSAKESRPDSLGSGRAGFDSLMVGLASLS